MKHITIGEGKYRLLCVERDGQWLARAHREDTGDPFGIECGGASEADAIDRLTRWLEWQKMHAQTLDALQAAERAYHRTIADGAFAHPADGATEPQKESLATVDAARILLDEIRARRP